MSDKPQENPVQTPLAIENQETLRGMQKRHRRELRTMIRVALENNNWSQNQAAQELRCNLAMLQIILDRSPALRREADERAQNKDSVSKD